MASTSKGGSSRRKAGAPGKLRIQLKGKNSKVVSDEDSLVEDSDEEIAAENGIPTDLPEGTVVVQPEAVENTQAKKKNVPVRIDTSVLDNVACTACGRQLNPYKNGAFHKHPELKVVICRRCEKFLSSGEISKDKDGADEQCRWCGQGGRLTVCDECSKAFCKSCIMRNFNRSEFNNINEQKKWRCYLCDKAPLQGLRENYRNVRDTLKALQARDKAKAAAASGSNSSAAAVNGTTKSKKPGHTPQGATNRAAAGGSERADSCSLSAEDLAFDSAGLPDLMDQLSVATNTFRDMLRALRSQFEGQKEDSDDDGPPRFKFSMGENMSTHEKEHRCCKALSMGLETYFKSLKKILVKHRMPGTGSQKVGAHEVGATPEVEATYSSSKKDTENVPGTKNGQNKTTETSKDKGQSKKKSPEKILRQSGKGVSSKNDKIRALQEGSTSISYPKRLNNDDGDSENDVITLSDDNEEEEFSFGKTLSKPSSTSSFSKLSFTTKSAARSSKKEKTAASASHQDPFPICDDENMAAKLELLNEQMSQGENDASVVDENMAAKLELLYDGQIPSQEDKTGANNEDENAAARNDLLSEETPSQCDTNVNNENENMAAKLDLLKELADKMINDEEDNNDEELPISIGSPTNQQETPSKDVQGKEKSGKTSKCDELLELECEKEVADKLGLNSKGCNGSPDSSEISDSHSKGESSEVKLRKSKRKKPSTQSSDDDVTSRQKKKIKVSKQNEVQVKGKGRVVNSEAETKDHQSGDDVGDESEGQISASEDISSKDSDSEKSKKILREKKNVQAVKKSVKSAPAAETKDGERACSDCESSEDVGDKSEGQISGSEGLSSKKNDFEKSKKILRKEKGVAPGAETKDDDRASSVHESGEDVGDKNEDPISGSEDVSSKDSDSEISKKIPAAKKDAQAAKQKTISPVVLITDVSSSDLLLSSDGDLVPSTTPARRKKRTKRKTTSAQEKAEKTSVKAKQPQAKKEQENAKKPPVTKSKQQAGKAEAEKAPKEDKQGVAKSEAQSEDKSSTEAKPKVNGKKKEGVSQELKDDIDKEIEKLSKLPTLRKRKAKEMDGGANCDDGSSNEKQGKEVKDTTKKSKPGPKSSKVGKKNNDYDELSSDNEEPAASEEEDEEHDELEPSVTFFLEPDNEGDDGDKAKEQNDEAKKALLEDVENDSDDEEEENDGDASSSDEDSDDDSKKKSKKGLASAKKKRGKSKEEKDEEAKEKADKDKDGEEDSEEEIKTKKPIRSKLLDANLSDSDDSDVQRPKKKQKESDGEASKGEESSSGSSLPSDSLEDEDDSDKDSDDEDESKKKKKGKKKGGKRRKKKKGKKGSDEEEEEGSEEDSKKKKGKGKKRKRIKKMADSSDEKGDDDNEDDDDENKSGKRKQIRKVMSNKKLEDSTKAAAKAEEKRRKRIAAKQREFNIETITDDNNPMNCPITTKLILEPGKEEGDPPVVEVNRKLVRKLKPHQVEAVQFMWDCMFESVKRSKKEDGAGCILAHCMGLGKTLSVISFVHTILTHQKVLSQKTCLVVSPLNTVLNWQNEWGLWLDEEDQLDVWELAGCKQNPARADMLKEWQSSGGIMIIGYEMYRNLSQGARCKNKRQKKIFFETLVNPGPDLVVCDEGHILKNEASSISKSMNQMKTRRRVVLTGTPLQNNLNEYHCMLSFVKPNLLGTRKEFNNRFISPIQNGQCTDSTSRDVKLMKARAHVLHEMLAGCVQRRDYSALTKFLPPKQEYVISVRLTNIQIELYEQYLLLSGQGVDGVFTNKGARLFSDYQNLMKIWTHPWVLKLAEIRDELKMKYDDEDSFIDDESEAERSFSSSESSSEDEKLKLSDSGGEGTSLGPHSKKGTRRTRAKARRQAGEDSDPEEVIAEWKSKTRNGKGEDEEEAAPPEGSKSVTKEWWAAYVTEEDQHKVELSNKLFLLFEILKMCEEIGDKVLIFSQSILSLNIIENFLERIDSKFQQECDELLENEIKDEKESFGRSWTKNLDYYRMDGSTSAQNRQQWAANFNDIDNYRTRLFLISTKAGGLGINLVAANRVIIFDASWNPSHDVQSIFRVYRFGQTKPCYIYRFLAQGTMEEKIYERQVTKLSLSQRVVDEHQIERHFSANDLKELYNFKPDRWDDGTEKPTLALPKDPLLAEVMKNHKHCVLSFHEHDSLLENQIEQTLTEEEKKAAWEEYENEKKGIIVRGPGMERTASWPMMAAAQILSREQITATVQALRQRLPDISEDLFHLHVQQELRRQVQMKQEEMRRMEMLRMQELNFMNMIKYQAQQSGLSYEEVQSQMAPWIQMQRLRAMQTHLMGGMGGMHPSASMSMMGNMGGSMGHAGASAEHISNKPEEAINLDDN